MTDHDQRDHNRGHHPDDGSGPNNSFDGVIKTPPRMIEGVDPPRGDEQPCGAY